MLSGTMRICNVEAEPGEKAFDFIGVGETIMSPVNVPVTLINGSTDGPTLCVTAGTHGLEYCGIEAVIRVSKEVRPDSLSGALIAVPVVNMAGFQARRDHVCPIDSLDIAYLWPGSPSASISYKIAHMLLNDVISKADYHIDCHDGDLTETLFPFTRYWKVGDQKLIAAAEAIARAYGPEYVSDSPLPIRSGQAAHGSNLASILAVRGIPSILAESGGDARLEESAVAVHARGITNVMKYLGMLEGDPILPAEQKLAVKAFPVDARHSGLVFPHVKLGDLVSAGQRVGEIRDLRGDVVDELVAAEDGVIRFIYTHRYVNAGDTLMVGWSFKRIEKPILDPRHLPHAAR